MRLIDLRDFGRTSDFVRAPGGGSQDNSRGPLLPQRFSPDPRWAANEILQVLAVDCVLPATGAKLFAGVIKASNRSHRTCPSGPRTESQIAVISF